MKNKNIFKSALIAICFAAINGYAQNDSAVFTSSGNFIVPVGVTSITIEVVGAGAPGGGNGGGGGGGGGYAKGNYSVVSGTSYPVTVGVSGSGVIGGTTMVSSLISATGGADGTSVPNPNIGGGGAGGTGMSGTVANYTGGAGGGGFWTYFGGGGGGAGGSVGNGNTGGNTIAWTGVCMTPGGSAGTGGGYPGGNGGKGAGFTDPNCNVTNPSGNGLNYGGGGGGANGNGGAAGTGKGGYCKITWATSVGITETFNNSDISISPNPNDGKFLISNSRFQILSIKITNVLGEIVFQSSENGQSTIDLTKEKKGIYFVQIQTEKGTVNKKIIIQ